MTPDDQKRFAESLLDPPKPNQKLIEARELWRSEVVLRSKDLQDKQGGQGSA